jgi:hypothetical protein
MLALRDLQAAFRRELLEPNALHGLEDLILADGLPSSERIAIYRNNVFASLTQALRETFPVVSRLVGERFFDYAAHNFITACPPEEPQLSRYGRRFSDFLGQFPPCRELVYLPDVARFEWALNEAAVASDAKPVSADVLAGIAASEAAGLVLTLRPFYRYLESSWPLDRIWRANRGQESGEINLDMGGVRLEVSRQGEEVVFRPLDSGEFVFRNSLAKRECLGAAIEAALAAAPQFQAAEALAALFHEGAVGAIAPISCAREDDLCSASNM